VTAVVKVSQRLGGGLGASEVAAALGLSPWKAPIVLWQELCGLLPRTNAGEAAEWGTKLEPLIRAEYVERHGVDVEIPRASVYHPEVPWARATPDGYILKRIANDEVGDLELRRDGILECKAPGLRMADHWGDEDEPKVPDYYVVQAVWSMWVTGQQRTDFAVLLGGQHYFEVPLVRDYELENDVVAAATEFWGHVQSRVPPPVDASDSHADYLKKKLSRASETIEATPEIDLLVGEWREQVCAAKRIKDQIKLTSNRVLAQMDMLAARRLSTTHGPIVLYPPTAKRNWKALAEHYATRLGADVDADIGPFTKQEADSGKLRRPNFWTKGDQDE